MEGSSSTNQSEQTFVLKQETDTDGIVIKDEPGAHQLVITADIYRKFLEKSTGFGKTPLTRETKGISFGF
jgi:hypothetical protein